MQHMVTLRAGQRAEYLADRLAARLASPEAAAGMLETLVIAEDTHLTAVQRHMLTGRKTGYWDDLRDALARLEAKIAEAEAKRDLIIAKLHRAQTQEAITDAVQNIQDRGADQSLERLEERADDRLAQAEALGQLTNQNLDQRFRDLETQSAVDSDLAALKQRLGKG
jgi:phage shock protein A